MPPGTDSKAARYARTPLGRVVLRPPFDPDRPDPSPVGLSDRYRSIGTWLKDLFDSTEGVYSWGDRVKPVNMNRRNVLSGTGFVLATGLGGCLQAMTPGNRADDEPRGTATLDTRLWLESVSLSTSDREALDPIVFRHLSETEQDIVQTAIDEGEYTTDSEDDSPALAQLRSRIEERTDDGRTLEVYLVREQSYYRVGFAAGDHIVAHPDR